MRAGAASPEDKQARGLSTLLGPADVLMDSFDFWPHRWRSSCGIREHGQGPLSQRPSSQQERLERSLIESGRRIPCLRAPFAIRKVYNLWPAKSHGTCVGPGCLCGLLSGGCGNEEGGSQASRLLMAQMWVLGGGHTATHQQQKSQMLSSLRGHQIPGHLKSSCLLGCRLCL